jgi:hypothetical protein
MTTQRGIGLLYTGFASLVFVSTLIARYLNKWPMFSELDLITIGCIIVFSLSIFFESKIIKISQVIMILLVCIGILMQGNYYLSLALFTNIFFIMFAYGVYNKHAKVKIVISVLLIYSMYLTTAMREGETLVYGFNWIVFVVVHITSIWLVFRSTVDKARKFDESKEMQLNQKINEMSEELYKNRIQLEKAVTLGMELLEINKDLDNAKR